MTKIEEVFSYLCVKSVVQAIKFYGDVFGAKEKFRLVEPSGRIGHAEITLGASTLMLSEEFPEYGMEQPKAGAPTSHTVHLHVDDCDAVMARAKKAGATIVMEPMNHFYGERSGVFLDPFGHRWNIGHHIEDVAPEEMQRRYADAMKDYGRK